MACEDWIKFDLVESDFFGFNLDDGQLVHILPKAIEVLSEFNANFVYGPSSTIQSIP